MSSRKKYVQIKLTEEAWEALHEARIKMRAKTLSKTVLKLVEFYMLHATKGVEGRGVEKS